MSEQKGYINLFSAKDIQRYLTGELSAAEMHAIEKAALDDPFLADAIEGMAETMSAHGELVIDTNLESIQQQLQNRVAKKNSARVIAFRWWYAAAAVVVIAGSIWLYNSSSNSASKEVAAQMPVKNKVQADSTIYYNVAPSSLPGKNKEVNGDVARGSYDQKSVASAKESRSARKNRKQVSPQYKLRHFRQDRDSSFLYDKDVAVAAKKDTTTYQSDLSFSISDDKHPRAGEQMKKVPGVEVSRSGTLKDSIETETVHVKPAAKAAASLSQDNKVKLHNVISGRVVDQFDNPLSNANVLTLDNRTLLTTDQYGLFKIPSSDSLIHVTVSVSGFNTQNFTLQSNAALNYLQLQPAENNIDRKNIGNAQGLYESKSLPGDNYSATITHQDAEPVNGWVNFEEYLIKNKKPPPGNPNVKGQVVISFIVNKKTGFSDFKVENHLAKGYDEEAIRLVREGPQWKLLKGRKTRVIVVVHF